MILRDDLVEVAKKKAAERKTTLSAIVDEALMRSLNPDRSGDATELHLPTYAPPKATRRDTLPAEFHELQHGLRFELWEPEGK